MMIYKHSVLLLGAVSSVFVAGMNPVEIDLGYVGYRRQQKTTIHLFLY